MSEIDGINAKLDRIIESMARMEVTVARDAEKIASDSARTTVIEAKIQDFEKDNQYFRGQIKMLTIIGSIAVGGATLSLVIIKLLALL